MSVAKAGSATKKVAERIADAASRRDKAEKGEKNDAPPKPQEPAPKADEPAPAADAHAGAGEAQPPTADEPPRAIPRPKAALSGAREGAAKADQPPVAETDENARPEGDGTEGKPVVEAIKDHITEREDAGDDQSGRRERLEEAQHQGDLQIELALDDAEDGKVEEPGYEREDADRAINDRGLIPIERYDATGRAIIVEQLAEEAARAKDAEQEQLDERRDDEDGEVDFAGMSAEERLLAYQTVTNEQALLHRESDVLDGGSSGAPTNLEDVDVDDDGHGGDIEGLDNHDRDARQAEIGGELERLEDLDDRIAATFTDDELDALGDGAEVTVEGADGESVTYAVSGELVDNVRERRDQVAQERPELVPTEPVADQPDPTAAADAESDATDPPGPDGAGGAPDDAAAPVPTDDQLLDMAAADGAIDPAARDRFTLNDAGELTYAAQPGDGYWQAAEHVAPPAGQDFASHWRTTWTENSMRNHGVPDEQFVGIDQPVVIPGYSRDELIAAYAPPAVEDPAGADAVPEPPTAADVPVTGTRDGDSTTLDVGGEEVVVAEDDFTNGRCLVDGTNVDQVDVAVGGEGGFTATVERSQSVDGGDVSYAVIETAPGAGADVASPGGAASGSAPAAAAPEGEAAPGADPAAAPVDVNETVMAGDHEVYAHGGDAVTTDGGGINVYQDGVQLAHVYDDGRVQLAEGSTDADIQAFLSQSLLFTDVDESGHRMFGYDIGGEAEAIDDPEHIEGYEILVDHYLPADEQPAQEQPAG